jgi:beta-glucosidase
MYFRNSPMVGPVLFAVVGGCGQTAIVGEDGDQVVNNGGQVKGDADGGRADTALDGGTASPITTSNPNLPQFACSAVYSQQFESTSMQPYEVSPQVAATVEATLQAMTPAQKATQLMGVPSANRNYRDIQRSSDVEVAGIGTIRGFRFRDAGRGVNLDAGQDNRADDHNNFATVFPTPALRAASWDVDLERRIGSAIGDETVASRNNVLTAPAMNIVRHPYWGRTQETYGEDSYFIGRMATAFTVGVQQNVLACAKHFAANNVEKARASHDSVMTEQTLREIYARHFEMVVQDGGVGCIMASYNLVNGVKSTQNRHLLRDVLKAPTTEGGLGFEGFVLTDWWAMPGEQNQQDAFTAQVTANEALQAGTDLEMPWQLHYAAAPLAMADQALVEESARRVLTQKFRFGSALSTEGWGKRAPTSTLTEGSIATNVNHEDLAEEAALKSVVLLNNGVGANGPVLPLSDVTSIAVIGVEQEFTLISSSVPKSCSYDPGLSQGVGNTGGRQCTFDFATDPALGDRATSRVNGDPERTVGPFAGITQAAGNERTVVNGNSADVGQDADAVVVVVGYTPEDETEEFPVQSGGDRSSLDLPPGHAELVQNALDLNKPTVIIIQSGSIVNLPWLSHNNQNQATVWAGYPGVRGGVALGKLIFGEANFSGKMPMAWPAEAELPRFKDSDTQTSMGYFFGYRDYDKRKYVDGQAVDMVFPFGHGISYSNFEYSNISLPCETVTDEAVFNVSVDVTNVSDVDGEETVMLFIKPPAKPAGITGERPWKELKSFSRVAVAAGQTVSTQLPLRVRDLRRWEGGEEGGWVTDAGDYRVIVAKNADDAETTTLAGTITVSGN